RAGVPDHVVAEDVVLDVPLQMRELPTQALDDVARRELGCERQRRHPVADARRERIRVPGVAALRRVVRDPRVEGTRRGGQVTAPRPPEHFLPVLRVEAPETRLSGKPPVEKGESKLLSDERDGAVARDRVRTGESL